MSPSHYGYAICILYRCFKIYTRKGENNVRDRNIFNLCSVRMTHENYGA
jgi:hypothetical protein